MNQQQKRRVIISGTATLSWSQDLIMKPVIVNDVQIATVMEVENQKPRSYRYHLAHQEK